MCFVLEWSIGLWAILRVWLLGWPSPKCHKYSEVKDKLEWQRLELEKMVKTKGFWLSCRLVNLAG
jgi:hypothetical protein